MEFISDELSSRPCYETSNPTSTSLIYMEDDALCGLLSLALACLKNHSSCFSQPKQFVDLLFDNLLLISPNNSGDIHRLAPPKFRSQTSRQFAFDILIELCRQNNLTFNHVSSRVIGLHKRDDIDDRVIVWDYWPRDDVRAPCGFVGLVNLGATCYMATSMQHLFMIPEAKECVLKSKLVQEGGSKNDAILRELKRAFSYLQVFESGKTKI